MLEGAAKAGTKAGRDGHVRTVHASRDGDSAILDEVGARASSDAVTVVTADRVLGTRCENLGARTLSPSWLLDLLG